MDDRDGHPSPGPDLRGIGARIPGVNTEKDMKVLVLDQTRRLILCAIDELGALGERYADSEFFLQAPAGSLYRRLTRPGMTATGIGPARRKMVFDIGTSLQQEAVIRIEDQDREGTVQLTVAMRIDLPGATEGTIPIIHQDDLLAGVALRCAVQGVGRKRGYDSSTQA
jgi:hypothetical protein